MNNKQDDSKWARDMAMAITMKDAPKFPSYTLLNVLRETGASARLRNVLNHECIDTFSKFMGLTGKDAAKFPNCGLQTWREIKAYQSVFITYLEEEHKKLIETARIAQQKLYDSLLDNPTDVFIDKISEIAKRNEVKK